MTLGETFPGETFGEKASAVAGLAHSIDYGPDWEFKAAVGQSHFMVEDSLVLTAEMVVADVDGKIPSGQARLRQFQIIDGYAVDALSVEALLTEAARVFWWLIEAMETHERMERFRVAGHPVYDPHPAGRTALRPDYNTPNLTGVEPWPVAFSDPAAERPAPFGSVTKPEAVIIDGRNYTDIPYLLIDPVPWMKARDGAAAEGSGL